MSNLLGINDCDGVELAEGDRVHDQFFGDGKVTGTCALEHGEGKNVLVEWDKKGGPTLLGRGGEHLKKLAATWRVRWHTGAQFENGEVHRRHGENEPVPGVEPEPTGAAAAAERATAADIAADDDEVWCLSPGVCRLEPRLAPAGQQLAQPRERAMMSCKRLC